MKLRELRRALQAIVLAGVPAGAGLAGCDDDVCVDTFHRTWTLQVPADPPLQLRIEACRLDVDACYALCEMAMERAGIGDAPTACDVDFVGDHVDVAVAWERGTSHPSCPVPGRRPGALAAPAPTRAASRAGAWLARAAWFEAASVHAFVQLAGELEHHGAPPALVRWALASAADEVRHTTLMTGLALRHGARPPCPEVARVPARTLAALALDNAVEGCVHETWAAVVAAWQARHAHDPQVRAIFAAIAEDELRHAALAWAIDRWLAPRLDDATRAAIAVARAHAAHALGAELLADDDADAALAALGLPDPHQGRALLDRARRALWNGGSS